VALDTAEVDTLCTRAADRRELQADAYAQSAMAEISIDEIGAVAEYFHLESERLHLLARNKVGLPHDWVLSPHPKAAEYLAVLRRALATSNHPTFLFRYMRFLSLLADRGAQLERSLYLLVTYGIEAYKANAICPEDRVLFQP